MAVLRRACAQQRRHGAPYLLIIGTTTSVHVHTAGRGDRECRITPLFNGTKRADLSWRVWLPAPQRQDDPGVSRGSALDDDGSVFSRELDPDLLPHDAATRDAARPPWLARTEVLVDRGPGYARLSGGACFADAKRAAA